jgi:hypothetical protein
MVGSKIRQAIPESGLLIYFLSRWQIREPSVHLLDKLYSHPIFIINLHPCGARTVIAITKDFCVGTIPIIRSLQEIHFPRYTVFHLAEIMLLSGQAPKAFLTSRGLQNIFGNFKSLVFHGRQNKLGLQGVQTRHPRRPFKANFIDISPCRFISFKERVSDGPGDTRLNLPYLGLKTSRWGTLAKR